MPRTHLLHFSSNVSLSQILLPNTYSRNKTMQPRASPSRPWGEDQHIPLNMSRYFLKRRQVTRHSPCSDAGSVSPEPQRQLPQQAVLWSNSTLPGVLWARVTGHLLPVLPQTRSSPENSLLNYLIFKLWPQMSAISHSPLSHNKAKNVPPATLSALLPPLRMPLPASSLNKEEPTILAPFL